MWDFLSCIWLDDDIAVYQVLPNTSLTSRCSLSPLYSLKLSQWSWNSIPFLYTVFHPPEPVLVFQQFTKSINADSRISYREYAVLLGQVLFSIQQWVQLALGSSRIALLLSESWHPVLPLEGSSFLSWLPSLLYRSTLRGQ